MELVLEQSSARVGDLDAGFTGPAICQNIAEAENVDTEATAGRKAVQSMEQLRASLPSYVASSFAPSGLSSNDPNVPLASMHAADTTIRVQQPQQEQLPFSSPSAFFSLLPLPDMSVESTYAPTNNLTPSTNLSVSVPERAPDAETAHFNACLYALTQIQQQEQMQTPSFPVPQSVQGGSTRQQRRGAVSERGLDALTIACLSQHPLPQAPPLQYPLPETVAGSSLPQDLAQIDGNTSLDRSHQDLAGKRLSAEQNSKPSKEAKKTHAKKTRHQKVPSATLCGQNAGQADNKRASNRAEELFEFLRQQYSSSAGIVTPSRTSENTIVTSTGLPRHNSTSSISAAEISPPSASKRSSASISMPSFFRRKSTLAPSRKVSGEAARAANRTRAGVNMKDETQVEEDNDTVTEEISPHREGAASSRPWPRVAVPGPVIYGSRGNAAALTPKRPFAVGSLVVFWVANNGFTVKLFGRVEKMNNSTADIQVISKSGNLPRLSVSGSSGAGSESNMRHCEVPFQNILAFDQAHALNLSG